MTELVVVLGLGAISWMFRIFFVVLIPARRLPDPVPRGLQFLAPAVLAALAAVGLTSVLDSADLYGGLVAIILMAVVVWVAHRFRSLTITVTVALVGILTIDLLVL